MKVITLFLALIYGLISFSQNKEFKEYSNGLIYSDTTMYQLESIVDSLNLKFKVCELTHEYKGLHQTKTHHFSLRTNDHDAINDLKNNISFEQFVNKYPDCDIEKELLLVRIKYENYDGENIIEYSTVPLNNDYEYSLDKKTIHNTKLDGNWIYTHGPGGKGLGYVNGFYIVEDFKEQPLPEKYARLIQYTDCMIDTSAQIYTEDAEFGHVELPENYSELDLNAKKSLLNEMRNTKVMGQCSMDNSPRLHAKNIAILSAETINWEVFLRAHLDIMNDRFERMSDGSYAYERRNTYIKELEELDINVQDLILGISLRIENPSENHYYGSIGRLGRALAESSYSDEIESEILNMIQDNTLDDYNRIIMCYLYKNYIYYIGDEGKKNERLIKLDVAIKKLPMYLSSKLLEKTNEENE